MVLGKLDSHMQNDEPKKLYYTSELKIHNGTIKLEENTGNTFLTSVWQWFFRIWQQKKGKKSKNKQEGLYQTKKLLQSKGNHHQNEKLTYYWMGENIRKSYVCHRLNIQNKELTTQQQENQTVQL